MQDWLNQHTFPLEARYQDIDFARQAYPSLVITLLANGTTTAMYFATVHEEATQLLASTCQRLGQRANVGCRDRASTFWKRFISQQREALMSSIARQACLNPAGNLMRISTSS